MSQNVVKAELTQTEKGAVGGSWHVQDTEVIFKTRENRSSRPEVVYHLSPPSPIGRQYESTPELRLPVIHQPQSTPKLVWPSAPPLKELATPSPVASPIVKTLTYPLPSPQPIVPVWQSPLVVDDVFEETIEETDMAEERSVMPPPFTGKSEDANDWARHFYKYCVYKEYDDRKALPLFKVLMVGPAADWLESLPEDKTKDYKVLKKAFDERFQTPEVVKFKSAKAIFSRRQADDENVDEFCESMLKLGRRVEVDEAMLRYAILNGLRPEIAAYVTQQKVTTMEQLLEAARVAELTAPNKGVADNTILEQLADVRSEVKRMAANWDRLTASPIVQQRSRPASASPKRVTFDESPQRSQYVWNQGMQQRNIDLGTYRGGPSQATWGDRPRARTGYQYSAQTPQQRRQQQYQSSEPQRGFGGARPQCQKCGRPQHDHPNYCPAINQNCRCCGRKGHFARVCFRAAPRMARPQDQN